MDRSEFYAKLDVFMKLLEKEMNEQTKQRFSILHETAIQKGRRGHHEIEYDEGKRFVRVYDQGESQRFVRYFVEKDTGVIFGAKSWKAYNPNHEYGTLDTINEWDWSDFYGRHKQGKKSLVPKGQRR